MTAYDPDSETPVHRVVRLVALACALLATTVAVGGDVLVVGNGGPTFERVQGLAYDPVGRTLYGTEVGGDGRLLRIDPETGRATAVGSIGFGHVSGLAFDPDTGTLFGVDPSAGVLLTIDTASGVGTSIADSRFTPDALAFDRASGRLYGVRGNGIFGGDARSLVTFDPATGAWTTVVGWLPCGCVGIDCGGGPVVGLSPGDDEDGLIVAKADGSVFRLDLRTSACERVEIRGGLVGSTALAFDTTAGVARAAILGSRLGTVDFAIGSVELPRAAGANTGNVQTAIDRAGPGDTVLVLPGTYGPFLVDREIQVLGAPFGTATAIGDGRPMLMLPLGDPPLLSGITVESIEQGDVVAVFGFETAHVRVAGSRGIATLGDVFAREGISIEDSADVRLHRATSIGPGARVPGGDGIFCCADGGDGSWVRSSTVELVSSGLRGGHGDCDPVCCGVGGDWCNLVDGSGLESMAARVDLALSGMEGEFPAMLLKDDSDGTVAGVSRNVVPHVGVWAGTSLRYSGALVPRVIGPGAVFAPALRDPTLELEHRYTRDVPIDLVVHAVPGASISLLIGAAPDRVATSGVAIDRLVLALEERDLGAVGETGETAIALDLPAWWPENAPFLAQVEATYPDGEIRRTNSVATPTDGTPERFAFAMVCNVRDDVDALADLSVTTRGNRRALANFLSQAAEHLGRGEFAIAENRLGKAIERVDGCDLRGAPDPPVRGKGPIPDFVVDCEDQAWILGGIESARRILADAGLVPLE